MTEKNSSPPDTQPTQVDQPETHPDRQRVGLSLINSAKIVGGAMMEVFRKQGQHRQGPNLIEFLIKVQCMDIQIQALMACCFESGAADPEKFAALVDAISAQVASQHNAVAASIPNIQIAQGVARELNGRHRN